MSAPPASFGEVAGLLACPHCRGRLAADGGSLACGRGHRFDVARQGYVNLAPTGTPQGSADTAAMVAARSAFYAAGHYAPLTDALVQAAHTAVARPRAVVIDSGAGPGDHLAAVVEGRPGWHGIAVDLSKHAMRRAARVHPRIRAVVGDVWRQLPLRDGTADLVQCVFAPRNLGEVLRVLRPDGAFVLATPAPGHLASLIARLDLMAVDPRKPARIAEETRGRLVPECGERVTYQLALARDGVEALVLMGPNARHVTAEQLRERLARLPEPVHTACEIDVTVYRSTPR